MAVGDPGKNKNSEFQQLQRTNNTFKAAYAEFAEIAFGEWVNDFQVDESVLNKFTQTPDGKRVEVSVARAVIPISQSELRCILFDTSAWRPLWPQIVHEAHSCLPSDIFQRLSESSMEGSSRFPDEILQQASEWSSIIKVHVRLLLPTPIVPIQEYHFLRYQKQIREDLWAIIDVSEDYCNDALNPEAELDIRRRPSGIIIKETGINQCEITWVENMEMPTLAQANLFWIMVNSNMAFEAKQWVGTLFERLQRQESNLFDYDVEFASEHNIQQSDNPYLCECLRNQVIHKLLNLTTSMEMQFFKTISAEPNEKVWSIVFDERVRIMKDITVDQGSTLIAISSILVPAGTILVYQFLVQESLHLLKKSFVIGENKPKEVLWFSGGECIVTLQRKLTKEGQGYDYIWKATQINEFCSFIIAHEMIEEEISDIFSFRVATERGKSKSAPSPAGFVIMPGGVGNLRWNSSIVTIAVGGSFDDDSEAEAITSIKNHISVITSRIERIFNKKSLSEQYHYGGSTY